MGKSVCFRNDYNKSLTSKVEQNLHYQMMAQQNKKLQRNLVTEESNMKRNSKSMATLSHYDLIYHCSLPNMQQCTYLQQATEVSTKIWKTTKHRKMKPSQAHSNAWLIDVTLYQSNRVFRNFLRFDWPSVSFKDVLLFRVCFSRPINMKQSLKFSQKSPSTLFLLNIRASRFFIASIHKIDYTKAWIVLIFII